MDNTAKIVIELPIETVRDEASLVGFCRGLVAERQSWLAFVETGFTFLAALPVGQAEIRLSESDR